MIEEQDVQPAIVEDYRDSVLHQTGQYGVEEVLRGWGGLGGGGGGGGREGGREGGR